MGLSFALGAFIALGYMTYRFLVPAGDPSGTPLQTSEDPEQPPEISPARPADVPAVSRV
jgi:hypothetical protein